MNPMKSPFLIFFLDTILFKSWAKAPAVAPTTAPVEVVNTALAASVLMKSAPTKETPYPSPAETPQVTAPSKAEETSPSSIGLLSSLFVTI